MLYIYIYIFIYIWDSIHISIHRLSTKKLDQYVISSHVKKYETEFTKKLPKYT